MNATTSISDEVMVVAINIRQGRLKRVQNKLKKRDLSQNMLGIYDSGSSLSLLDKSILCKLQNQGGKTFSSVPEIHGSQEFKTETV